MNDPVIVASRKSLARESPGRGDDHPDDGVPGTTKVRIRSIPNVSTARLLRRLDHLNQLLSPEGMRLHDDTRRALIHLGVHRQAIRHELDMRGTP